MSVNHYKAALERIAVIEDDEDGGDWNEINEARSVATEALARPEEAGWRPIEDAPKDGTEVWAFNARQGRMHWTEGEMPGGSWALWVWADQLLADADPGPDQPTHWMPLPPAPKSAA